MSSRCAALLLFLLAGCSSNLPQSFQKPASASSASPAPAVIVTGPSQVRLGSSVQYSALPGVSWSVNSITGGSASTGLISTSGIYSPSSTALPGHSVTIAASTASIPTVSSSLSVQVLN